jgi:hypothetical protein
MKKQITMAFVLCCTMVQAQYFQHWYNRSMVAGAQSNETFNDGLRSRANYAAGNPNNWFFIGYGQSNNSGTITPANTTETRFVRVDKSGAPVNVNIGTSFADVNTTSYHHSIGNAICEINNGAGNGGYIAVGEVSTNFITGSVVPGDHDGLFYRLNGAGTAASRVRFDVLARADVFTDVYASRVTPGTYYVCGYSKSATDMYCIVMSISSTGVVGWFNTYWLDPTASATSPFNSYCRANALVEDINTGNIVVVGSIMDPNSTFTGNDGLVFTLSPAGALLCATKHHVFIDDSYEDVIQKANGMFAATGYIGDGTTIPAMFYGIWLTELNPFCVPLASSRYLQGNGTVTNPMQCKGYSLIERQNSGGGFEYYIAGPNKPAGGDVASITKINAVPGLPPVAWYGYAAQSGAFESGYAIDHSLGINNKTGLALFSNTNAPAATFGANDSYLMRAYYNGATCINNCNPLPLFQQAVPLAVAPCNDSINNIYKRKNLVALNSPYTFGVICTQNNIGCGSNFKTSDNLEESVLDIYPNPANGLVNLQLYVENETQYQIEAIDVIGRTTLLSDAYLTAGEQAVTLDISHLSKGVYSILVKGNGKIQTIKLVVQ